MYTACCKLTGAARAVDVRLGVSGHAVLHDEVDAGDVDATCGNVSGDKHLKHILMKRLTRMYICIHTHMYIHMYTHTHMHTNIYIIYIYIYMNICLCRARPRQWRQAPETNKNEEG